MNLLGALRLPPLATLATMCRLPKAFSFRIFVGHKYLLE